MRDEMLGAVVRRAIEHPEFRQRLMDDPQGALAAHGFALEEDDMREIESLRGRVSGNGGDVEQELVSIAERLGVNPSPEK